MSIDQQSIGGVLMLSGDLMFASKVKSAAARVGRPFQLSGAVPDEPLDSLAFVILDLATRGKLLPRIVEDCRARCPQAQLIAFGPHVQVDALAAARRAGVPTVMTNGQFDRALSSMLWPAE
jgi:hypothetical protein